MAVFTEGRHTGEFVLSTIGNISYQKVTIVSGAGVLRPGAVLGALTTGGKFQLSPATGSDGSQVASAVLLGDVDATSADVAATVIDFGAELKGVALNYHASVDDATKRAAKATQLLAKSIKVR